MGKEKEKEGFFGATGDILGWLAGTSLIAELIRKFIVGKVGPKIEGLVTIESDFTKWKDEILVILVEFKLTLDEQKQFLRFLNWLRKNSKAGDKKSLRTFVSAVIMLDTVGYVKSGQPEFKGMELKYENATQILKELTKLIGNTNNDADFKPALDWLENHDIAGRAKFMNLFDQFEHWFDKKINKLTADLPGYLQKVKTELTPAADNGGFVVATKALDDWAENIRKKREKRILDRKRS